MVRVGCCITALLIIAMQTGETKVKTWIRDSDILNKANWMPKSEDCRGMIFQESNSAPVVVENLTSAQIILPQNGQLRFVDGSSIVLDETKSECIKLKPIDYGYWFDYQNWHSTDDNPAIPHLDRTACLEDDVIFPKPLNTRILIGTLTLLMVKSVKLGNEWISHFDFNLYFGRSEIGEITIINPESTRYFPKLAIAGVTPECNTSKGCKCQANMECPPLDYHQPEECLAPIKPFNFCHGICGASFTFLGSQYRIKINALKQKLKQYQSSTHVGWIGDVVQVVFAEKHYRGASLVDAKDFEEWIFTNHNVTGNLQQSGTFVNASGLGGTLIVFASLLGVTLVFLSLYYYHQRPEQVHILIGRLRQTRGGSLFFARFDNTDERLVIDQQSMAGSVLDLGKSFENPMFGRQTSASTSTSTLENPMYDVSLPKDADDDDHEE